MFNEKLMAGLGRGLRETGRLEEDAMAAGERALARFAGLARSIGVSRLRAVATAAVRQASNGPDFVDRVKRTTGLRLEGLSGVAVVAASASGAGAGVTGADGHGGARGGGRLDRGRVASGGG